MVIQQGNKKWVVTDLTAARNKHDELRDHHSQNVGGASTWTPVHVLRGQQKIAVFSWNSRLWTLAGIEITDLSVDLI